MLSMLIWSIPSQNCVILGGPINNSRCPICGNIFTNPLVTDVIDVSVFCYALTGIENLCQLIYSISSFFGTAGKSHQIQVEKCKILLK